MKMEWILLVLAALIVGACADTSGSEYRGRNSIIDRANTCATCGASVRDDYFAGSALKAVGPGSY
jgi:hypothetical protein